ncbi:MAG: DNA-binding protein WhiA [Clostridia bacterium]|nr:DNA-binding protein WhiA [Clostridia bacterium]MDD4047545.1 DNA-binding protein WhiA [Clostridia bacterium]
MSFSTKTKDELAHLFTEKNCCEVAELAALIRMNGTITIGSQQHVSLIATTGSSPVARKIFRLFKKTYNLEPEIRIQRRNRFKKSNCYSVYLNDTIEVRSIIKELGVLNEDGNLVQGISQKLIKSKCCRRSYLRGAFLGAGSVSDPGGNYHLELVANNEIYAYDLAALMNTFLEIQAKVGIRKNLYIVYLKESEQIVSFLSVVGAHTALLDFENVRIVKGMRNKVNRLVNCDTANLKKSVDASLKQIEHIKLIDSVIGLDKLALRLREVARLRLENPDISLKELGEMMKPVVGKSGINHRFRKIELIANDLRGKNFQ